MSLLNIRKATRTGSKIVLGIAGQSGSGKTLTALKIARGMVDNSEQIGFLDTENGRGSLYADKLDGQFLIADLAYPFTPARYAEAIREFEKAGVKVLVIDSVTHEWEIGCMEIAEAPLLQGKKMADWKRAKHEHKKFMNTLLQSGMHIICCIRAAEKTDFTDPRNPKSLGIQPSCEKNFMFEMTASIMMFNEGFVQEHRKIPIDLKEHFAKNSRNQNGVVFNQGYLGEETGTALRNWAEGEGFDEVAYNLRSKMRSAATEGTEALTKAWKSMSPEHQEKLKDIKLECWRTAQASEAQEKMIQGYDEDCVNDDSRSKDDVDEKPVADFNPGNIKHETKMEPKGGGSDIDKSAKETQTDNSVLNADDIDLNF